MYWSGSLSSVCPVSAPTSRIKQDKLKFSNVTRGPAGESTGSRWRHLSDTRAYFLSLKVKKNINLRIWHKIFSVICQQGILISEVKKSKAKISRPMNAATELTLYQPYGRCWSPKESRECAHCRQGRLHRLDCINTICSSSPAWEFSDRCLNGKPD